MGHGAGDATLIPEFAQLATRCTGVAQSVGTELAFDLESILRLDGFIDDIAAPGMDNMALLVGSFLGETWVRLYGGRWVWRDTRWAIEFPDRPRNSPALAPFEIVKRRFDQGMHGSISELAIQVHLQVSQHPARVLVSPGAGRGASR